MDGLPGGVSNDGLFIPNEFLDAHENFNESTSSHPLTPVHSAFQLLSQLAHPRSFTDMLNSALPQTVPPSASQTLSLPPSFPSKVIKQPTVKLPQIQHRPKPEMVNILVGSQSTTPHKASTYRVPRQLLTLFWRYIDPSLGWKDAEDHVTLPRAEVQTFDYLAYWMVNRQFPPNFIKYVSEHDPFMIIIDTYGLAQQFGIVLLKNECINAMDWMRKATGVVPNVACLNRIWYFIHRDYDPFSAPHEGIRRLVADWYVAMVAAPLDVPDLAENLRREALLDLLGTYAGKKFELDVQLLEDVTTYHEPSQEVARFMSDGKFVDA